MKIKLFFVFTSGFIVGTIFEAKKIFSLFFVTMLFVIFIALFFWFKSRNIGKKTNLLFVFSIFIFCILLGSFRFKVSELSFRHFTLHEFVEEKVEVIGTVEDDSYIKNENNKFVMKVKMLNFDNRITKIFDEKISIYTKSIDKYHYGDLVVVKGKLQKIKNKGDSAFDYESFSKKDGILFQIFNADIKKEKNIGNFFIKKLKFTKAFLEDKISFYLSEPHASLVSGMIVAGKKSLPQDIQDKFIRTGLIHVVVLSGFNIAVIIGFLKSVFEVFRINRRLAFFITVASLIIFVLIVGASPPVIRSVIMASIILLGKISYKNLDANKVLIFVAFLLCLWNPYSAPFDTSFQLSFLATFAIINLSPVLERYFTFLKIKILRETVSQTLSAIIMVSPLILFLLGNFSVIALPVNVLVLPIIPILMLFGFLIPILSFLPFLSFTISFIVFALSSYLFFVVDVASKIPFASFSIKGFPFYIVIIIYILIFLFLKKNKKPEVISL